MKYVASCSFGKDSLCMVLKLIDLNYRLDEVVFYDTGMEFESIYNNRNKLKKILDEKNIRFTELKGKHQFLYQMLVKPVKGGKHYGYEWCGGRTRWGTTNKTSAIRNHYKRTYGTEEVFEYVGIAFDELQRVKDDTHKLYPLVDWRMTEQDALDYCYSKGFNWNENGVELYDILDRVSCWCCQNKNLKELQNMWFYLPEYFERLKGLQSRMTRPMKAYGTVFELEERFKMKGGEIMNKNLFVSKMKLFGDTQEALADELEISVQTLNAKINGGAEFKMSEIRKIKEKYRLSCEEVDAIFFCD